MEIDINKRAKNADIGSVSKFLKHSLAFIDRKLYSEKLYDKDPKVRAIASYGLGVLQDKKYLPDLINILKNDENEIVRVSAVLGLSFYKKLDILGEVEFALDDKSDLVKISLVDLFTKHKYLMVKDRVVSFLDSDDYMLKLFVLDYISALSLKEYKDKVFNTLSDKNPAVVQNAIVTLFDLGAKEYADRLFSLFSTTENPLISMALDWFKA